MLRAQKSRRHDVTSRRLLHGFLYKSERQHCRRRIPQQMVTNKNNPTLCGAFLLIHSPTCILQHSAQPPQYVAERNVSMIVSYCYSAWTFFASSRVTTGTSLHFRILRHSLFPRKVFVIHFSLRVLYITVLYCKSTRVKQQRRAEHVAR